MGWVPPPVWQVSSHKEKTWTLGTHRGEMYGDTCGKVTCNPGQGGAKRTSPGPLPGTPRSTDLPEKTHIVAAIQCVGFDCDGPRMRRTYKSRSWTEEMDQWLRVCTALRETSEWSPVCIAGSS